VSEQNLGERIRELREKKNLSREQLHSQTKILVKYIEAIEEGRWDLLPGLVYLKPFIKNIAGALDVDCKELYALIEDTSLGEKLESEASQLKKKFDYRWVVVVLMIVFVALIIFLLKSPGPQIKKQTEETIQVEAANDRELNKRESQFSGELDFFQGADNIDEIHTLELTAIDSVWLLLLSGDDTLYTGILVPGRKIKRRCASPFELVMGRSNCLDIVIDDRKINREKYLKNMMRIKSSDLDNFIASSSGGPGEG